MQGTTEGAHMNQYDVRTFDRDDPNTPPAEIKAMGKTIADADDKYETFVITHEPINLKAKLALKKRSVNATAYTSAEDGQAINNAGDDGIDL
jgi:hypothetical protein